jgi:hypothetical protein
MTVSVTPGSPFHVAEQVALLDVATGFACMAPQA